MHRCRKPRARLLSLPAPAGRGAVHGVGGGRGDVADLKDPELSENDPLTALLGCDADQVVALLLFPSLVLSS